MSRSSVHSPLRASYALALVATAAIAVAERADAISDPCPGGAFVVDARKRLLRGRAGAQGPSTDLVSIASADPAAAQAAVASGCPATAARVRVTRRGTLVVARWPAGACPGTRGRVRLRARIARECDTLRGTVASRGRRRRFAARLHPGAVTATDEEERAVTVEVAAAPGGTVTATATNGTVFTLEIPPGALTDDTAITLTPLANVTDLLVGSFVVGVRLEPEGLQLYRAATLTADLPSAPPEGSLVALNADGNGARPQLAFARAAGTRLATEVTHFSLVAQALLAAAGGTVGALVLSGTVAGDPETIALATLVGLIAQGAPAIPVPPPDPPPPPPYVEALRQWYRAASFSVDLTKQGVRAAFRFVVDDDDLRQALRGYVLWKHAIDAVSSATGVDHATLLASELADMELVAASAIRARITRADQDCLANLDLARANDAMRLQAVAEALGLARHEFNLELALVLSGLCVHVDLLQATLPGPPQTLPLGVPAALTVQAGHRFGSQGPRFDRPLLVRVDAVGIADPEVPGGHTDAQGTFVTSLRPSGSPPLALDVHACFDEAAWQHLEKVCGTQHLASTPTTTVTTPSSTSTTLPSGAGVFPISRRSFAQASASAGAPGSVQHDQDQAERTDLQSSIGTVNASQSFSGEVGGAPASASATASATSNTTVVLTDGQVASIQDTASGNAQASHSGDAVGFAHGSVDFSFYFQVNEASVPFHLTGFVDRGSGFPCPGSFALWREEPFLETIAVVNDLTSPGATRAEIDLHGVLVPGTYRLGAGVGCAAGDNADNAPSRTGSYDFTLTFGP